MSISNRFFESLKRRENWLEILYYAERCEFNAFRTTVPLDWSKDQIADDREDMLDQAHRLYDLLAELKRTGKLPRQVTFDDEGITK